MFQFNSTVLFKLYKTIQHVLVVVCIIERQDSMEVKNTWALEPDCLKRIPAPVLNQLCDLGQVT